MRLDHHLSQDDIKGGENVEPVLPKNTLCREREHSSHTNYHSIYILCDNEKQNIYWKYSGNGSASHVTWERGYGKASSLPVYVM